MNDYLENFEGTHLIIRVADPWHTYDLEIKNSGPIKRDYKPIFLDDNKLIEWYTEGEERIWFDFFDFLMAYFPTDVSDPFYGLFF